LSWTSGATFKTKPKTVKARDHPEKWFNTKEKKLVPRII
jgi:hypothetical protein